MYLAITNLVSIIIAPAMKMVVVNAVSIREAIYYMQGTLTNSSTRSFNSSRIKQNYCTLQEIICSCDYDMIKEKLVPTHGADSFRFSKKSARNKK